MSEKVKTIILKESLPGSIISDATTFGFICFSFWFNQSYVNGSYFVNGLLLVMLIIWLFAKHENHKITFTSIDDAIRYLETSKENKGGAED